MRIFHMQYNLPVDVGMQLNYSILCELHPHPRCCYYHRVNSEVQSKEACETIYNMTGFRFTEDKRHVMHSYIMRT